MNSYIRQYLRRAVVFVALGLALFGCSGYSGPELPTPNPPPPPPHAQFPDVTAASGIKFTNGLTNALDPADLGLIASSGVAAGDFDNDGDVDLFIVRSNIGPNLLYRNSGNLFFEETAATAGLSYTRSTTENYRHSGPMFADLDGDGDLDLFVGGLGGDPSLIFENNGGGTFTDVTVGSGIDTLTAIDNVSAAFGDYDLDGDLDIYHTNSWPLTDSLNDFAQDTSRAFVSNGQGQFVDMAAELGIADTEEGRGVVCADFDNDGDVDILQLHRSSVLAATLWRNDNNNYLSVSLNGLAPNTQAADARIEISSGGVIQMREVSIGSNFVSQNPTEQIFGLANSAQTDTVTIQWPDGLSTILNDVQAGQFIVIDHPDL